MTLPLRYWKVNAAGNDFVLVEARWVNDGAELARQLCPRRTSIGADGLLVLEAELQPTVVHYDPDGSRSFCLNGLRAAACWLRERGLANERLTLETDAGPRPVEGPAVWAPPPRLLQRVCVEGTLGTWVDVGNPQFVVELADANALEHPELMQRAKELRWHAHFPAGTNVTYALRGEDAWHVRTYERGVEGETLSCGTGVVAAAAALVSGERANFMTRGGTQIDVTLEREHGALQGVWSSGPAALVGWGRARVEAQQRRAG